MGDDKPGRHRPREGSWIPAPRPENGFTVVGKATLKLLGKLAGWNNPNRDNG